MATIDTILPGGIHSGPEPQNERDHAANVQWYFEQRARSRKVAVVVNLIDANAAALGLPIATDPTALTEMIRTLRTQSPSGWAATFKGCDQHEPSAESVRMVVETFELRLGKMVSA
jgi:hypothetical protein